MFGEELVRQKMNTPANWEEGTNAPLLTSCKQAARLISLSCERRLTIREFLSMRLHLCLCKTCAFYRRQITALRAIFICHEKVLENTPATEGECLDQQARQRIQETIERNLEV